MYVGSALDDAGKLLVLLRDGRKLMGTLRSFDQFANAVLEGACERVIVGEQYCDIPLGLYVIRGENVVLIGELVRLLLVCLFLLCHLVFSNSLSLTLNYVLGHGERRASSTYDSRLRGRD
jgi:small nuclear ribonucleoprotein (snRNP)-like protein